MFILIDEIIQIKQFIINIDYILFELINKNTANTFFDIVMPLMRDKNLWIPLYFILSYIVYVKFKQKFIFYIFIFVMLFALVDYSNHHILKNIFQRLRPCYNETIPCRLLLESCGGKWSFPSGHAANHAAITFFVILIKLFNNKIYNYLFILWTVSIGFAQIYVGVHYPLDILFGFIYGIIIATVVGFVMRRFENVKMKLSNTICK